jgi:serine/threonine-protein kinase HipA
MNAYNGSQGLSEIEYLVGVDDQSRLGALRLRIAGGPFLAEKPTDRPSLPPVLDIDLITRDIARIERDHPDREALARLVGGGSSLGGARPKCTVVLADGGLALAKFTSRHDQHAIEKAEVLTLKLARLCGLDAPDAELIQSGPLPVALIRRFDRGKTGRVPYLSAQSFLGMAEATGGTYVDFADMLRKQALLPELSVRELFARVGFSILVSNTDDHLKNHGLLAGGNGQWRLSPLFDVNPSPERERYLKTAIADPGESQASLELLVDQAESFGLSSGEARRLVADQAQCIRAQW